MGNPSTASSSYRSARRSTRLDESIPITVSGVDSRRGPYSEQVATLTISCHGCKYWSKHQVLPEALVILELNPEQEDAAKLTARGRVKWTQRDMETGGGPFCTAVEFEDPFNIWKISSPPEDWLQFEDKPKREPESSQLKPFAVQKSDTAVTSTELERSKSVGSAEIKPSHTMAPVVRPVGHLMGEFQQQMEIMISEAADAAVREKTATILSDVHSRLREDAKTILNDMTAMQTAGWIEQSLRQMQRAGQERAQALESQWTKKIDHDLNQSLQRIDLRQHEVEELSETLFTNTLERLQKSLETFHKDAVERIVARLKDRMAPMLRDAGQAAGDLAKRKEDLEKTLIDASERTAAKVQETCEKLGKQFESVMRSRLNAAQEELERAATGISNSTIENIGLSADRYETETETRLRQGSDRVAEDAQRSLERKAAEASNDFAAELTHYSRSHLEFVSGAISELAKGIGTLSKH
jgi:predicted transcriptional regulator